MEERRPDPFHPQVRHLSIETLHRDVFAAFEDERRDAAIKEPAKGGLRQWLRRLGSWLQQSTLRAAGLKPVRTTGAGVAVVHRVEGDGLRGSLLEWRPLSGSRLVLGQTGFAIHLVRNPHNPPYMAVDPDGRNALAGFDLQAIKRKVERMAADRGEFHPLDMEAYERYLRALRDVRQKDLPDGAGGQEGPSSPAGGMPGRRT